MTDEPGVYDSSDPAAVEALRRESERRDKEDDETIRIWMNHPKGRDLLYRIVFQVCHYADLFIAADERGQTDTHRTFVNLGERNIGAWFFERMQHHPELFQRMLAEQEVERELRNARLKQQNEKQDERDGRPAD